MTAPVTRAEAFEGHTPGPWSYCGCGKCGIVSAGSGNKYVYVATAERRESGFCEEGVPVVKDAPQRTANARLIAAAPTLAADNAALRERVKVLEAALRGLLAAAEAAVARDMEGDCWPALDGAQDKARAALGALS